MKWSKAEPNKYVGFHCVPPDLQEAIILAKLPKMSRQELEVMFGVEDLRNTRFAQELIAEGEEKSKFKDELLIVNC